jgi:hypothetical protein
MDTEYATQLNSKPVIYLTLKGCNGSDIDSLRYLLSATVESEYSRYFALFKDEQKTKADVFQEFLRIRKLFAEKTATLNDISLSLKTLIQVVSLYFGINPIVILDEYDTPIISAYEYGYKDQLKAFFASFYGEALKSNNYLDRAVLTGIQRVAKESIFSQLNNVAVYTVLDELYSQYFGFTELETEELLKNADLELTDKVKNKYNGYVFGKTRIYNLWSILNYASKKVLDTFWVNTSSNTLVRSSIKEADFIFRRNYEKLLTDGKATVNIKLETSFIELKNAETLWGLLVNAGYLTVTEYDREDRMATLLIPNGEVKDEFISIVAEDFNLGSGTLGQMFRCLVKKDFDGFEQAYKDMLIIHTSYFDHVEGERSYHLFFLGMCLVLNSIYKITSNLEGGHGRYDIMLEALRTDLPHIVIEFKQGEDLKKLSEEAVNQIIEQKYYAPLTGEVICMGVAHNKKKCEITRRNVVAI